MFQQSLSDRCRNASLRQQGCKRFPQIVEFQIRQSCFAAYLLPLLGGESVCKQQFLSIWKSGNIVGQFRRDLFGNRAFCHRFLRFAVASRDRVAVKVDIPNSYGLDVPTPKPCRYGQQNPQAESRISGYQCNQMFYLLG